MAIAALGIFLMAILGAIFIGNMILHATAWGIILAILIVAILMASAFRWLPLFPVFGILTAMWMLVIRFLAILVVALILLWIFLVPVGLGAFQMGPVAIGQPPAAPAAPAAPVASSLQDQVKTLQTQVNDLQSKVNNLTTSKADAVQVSQLSTDLATAQKQLADLQTQVGNAASKSEVNALQNQLVGLQNQVNSLARSTQPSAPAAGQGGPTAPATGQVQPAVPSWSGMNTQCPTDAEVIKTLGLSQGMVVFTGENVPWDVCKWNLQGPVDNLPLVKGYEYTVTVKDANRTVATYYGGGSPATLSVWGATIRYVPSYNQPATQWVQEPCTLLQKEDDFGMGRTPSYHTVAGNYSCSATTATTLSAGPPQTMSSASISGSTSTQSLAPAAPAAPATPAQPQQAQPAAPAAPAAPATTNWINSKDQASSLIGGSASNWTAPTWGSQKDGHEGAWVYKGPATAIKYPGWGRLDVWINGVTKVMADNAGVLSGKTFDSFSFHNNSADN